MSKHSISHAKQQARALEDPNARAMLEQLSAGWDQLSYVERGDRIRALRNLYRCTNYGIAEVVPCHEGTIRRDLEIAELPPGDRIAIEQGASAEPFLRRQRDAEERAEDNSRLQQELLDGHVSDDLAWNVFWFLSKYAAGFCFHPKMRDELFSEVDFRFLCRYGKILSNLEREQWRFCYPTTRNRRNLGIVKLAHECRPPAKPSEGIADFECVIQAVMKFIERLENRLSIIDMALEKARRICRCLDNCCCPGLGDQTGRLRRCRRKPCHCQLVRKAKQLLPDIYASTIEQSIPEVRQAMQMAPHDYAYARQLDSQLPNSFSGVPLP